MPAFTKSIVLASYGGGHAASLLPVARRLQRDPFISLTCLGLTTARAIYEAAGVQTIGSRDMLSTDDREWLELATGIAPVSDHPSIEHADSAAYIALGIRDLAIIHGLQKALDLYSQYGRHIFYPFSSSLSFLRKLAPDLLITSTCPRTELALQNAAHQLSIPSLAIGDLFLHDEASYICQPNYASHLTVIAEPVRDYLMAKGCQSSIHVCGNPAFDNLFNPLYHKEGLSLRTQLGISEGSRVLLWACPPATKDAIGRHLNEPSHMLDLLTMYSSARPDVRVLVRRHPNSPSYPLAGLTESFLLCPEDSAIEACLHAADQVLIDVSTVGLQASLLNKSVVTYNDHGAVPYSKLGLAISSNNAHELFAALDSCSKPDLGKLSYPSHSLAEDSIIQLITRLLSC